MKYKNLEYMRTLWKNTVFKGYWLEMFTLSGN